MADTTVDLVTLAECYPSLNLNTATEKAAADTELAMIITGVSQRLRDMCGPIINTTYTDEVYSGGAGDLVLRNAPLTKTGTITVTAIKEYDSTGTLTTLAVEDFDTKPADSWIVDPDQRNRVLRRSYGGHAWFLSGVSNVLVTYTAGRAANTAAVPANFKVAALECIRHIWLELGAQSGAARSASVDGLPLRIASFSIPKAALDLIRDELTPSGLGLGVG